MKSFFSILFIPIRATLKEKVSIGLLFFQGEKIQFKVSFKKLQIIKPLISNDAFNFLKLYFKNLEKEINSDDWVFSDNTYKKNLLKDKWVNESYISYLSNYSNNIVQFSPVQNIAISFTEETFIKLFEKYIFNYEIEEEEEVKHDIHKEVEQILFPRLKDKVNLSPTLTSKHFRDLFTPIAVDFIGKNDLVVTGQTFDFKKQHYNLENDITRYVSLTKAIELSENDEGIYYVLGKEPDKKGNPKNYNTWKQVYNSKFLKFIDIDDSSEIVEYVDKHKVKPLIEE